MIAKNIQEFNILLNNFDWMTTHDKINARKTALFNFKLGFEATDMRTGRFMFWQKHYELFNDNSII